MHPTKVLILLSLAGLAALAGCNAQPANPTPAAGLPNPASVYCVQNSGKVELEPDASGGVAGTCVFPDGSACDEWAFFRGECRPGEARGPEDPAVSPVPVSPSPTAQAAATPPAVTSSPGLRVAYARKGHIMLWSEGGGSRPVADAENVERVRLSADGQVVAYLGRNARGVLELFAAGADGSGQRLLAGEAYLQALQPAGAIVDFDFAPGSHTLYFVTDQSDLHRVEPAGGAPGSIFGAGQGGLFSFSPDGRWITLYHPDELVLAHPDGTEARVVFQYPEDFRYTLVGPEIRWKSDASGFNLVSASGPQGSPDNMTVWFVPLAGEPVRQMAYTGPYGAYLSPDGRSVIYVDERSQPVQVHVVAADGQDTTYGTFANAAFMGWAPDSRHFLLNLSPDLRLYVPFLCAAGAPPARLSDTDDAFPVDWIDAGQVLYASRGQALHLQRLGAPSSLLDGGASSWFDYAIVRPR